MSTPKSRLGRSMMCPIEATTLKSGPRYLLMVFAFPGDSTMTRDLAIAIGPQPRHEEPMKGTSGWRLVLAYPQIFFSGNLADAALELEVEQERQDLGRRKGILQQIDDFVNMKGVIHGQQGQDAGLRALAGFLGRPVRSGRRAGRDQPDPHRAGQF